MSANESIELNFSKEYRTSPSKILLIKEGTWTVERECRSALLEAQGKNYDCFVYPFGEHIWEFNVLPKGEVIIYEKIKELVDDNKKWSNLIYNETKGLVDDNKIWSRRNFIVFVVTCSAAIASVFVSLWMRLDAKRASEKQIRHREKIDILSKSRVIRGLIEETKQNINTCKEWINKKETYLSEKDKSIPFNRLRVDSMRRVLVEPIIENEDLMNNIRHSENRFSIINNFLDRQMIVVVSPHIKVETMKKVFGNIKDVGVDNLEKLVTELDDYEKTLKPPKE
ncbi:MAG: hypothetical protein ABH851_05675 [Methanobacteriota archaeon]